MDLITLLALGFLFVSVKVVLSTFVFLLLSHGRYLVNILSTNAIFALYLRKISKNNLYQQEDRLF